MAHMSRESIINSARAEACRKLRIGRHGRCQQRVLKPGVNNIAVIHPATSVLRDGMWRGQRCFVIGGGPSLRGFDWGLLKGELTIGVNRVIERMTPTILYAMDTRFIKWLLGGRYGAEARDKFVNSDCLRVCLRNNPNFAFPPYVHQIPCVGGPAWSKSLKNGLGGGSNSGYGALNMASLLGASPIYLLGYDMKGDGGGKQAHWHDGHPETQPEKIYAEKFIPKYEAALPNIKETGGRIINLYRGSCLPCFEFGDMDDIPKQKKPTVVAYYTKGTGYEKEAERLRASLKPIGLNSCIVPIDNLGSWQANTQHKARFLREMFDCCKGQDLLYVDADATFERYPARLINFKGDIGIHYRAKKRGNMELLTGTIYLANNDRARALVDQWIEYNDAHPLEWDQRNLQKVLDQRGVENTKESIKREAREALLGNGASNESLKLVELPAEYCAIFDQDMADDPVIKHWQASRRLKGEVGA